MRRESDLLGVVQVPTQVHYGAHTVRALENFPFSGLRLYEIRRFVINLVRIKQAAAQANLNAGLLTPDIASAITNACHLILDSEFEEQFPLSIIQGGAGTSTNMNVNEVIANKALELSGAPIGDYTYLSPTSHVNRSQSTNDVYPTALRLTLHDLAADLVRDLGQLQAIFTRKGKEFTGVRKLGRTELQDAVEIGLDEEFAAFGSSIEEGRLGLITSMKRLLRVNLGGTAVGSCINAPPEYQEAVIQVLGEICHKPIERAKNLMQATADSADFIHFHGALKAVSVQLSKIASDIRLLSSGPRGGLGELILPPRQAGSSIMPGKVNPVIPEVVSQVSYCVMGNDVAISYAVESAQLQLSTMLPLIADRSFESLSMLSTAVRIFGELCVEGIRVGTTRSTTNLKRSFAVAPLVANAIGYDLAQDAVREAIASDSSFAEVLDSRGFLNIPAVQEIITGLVEDDGVCGEASV